MRQGLDSDRRAPGPPALLSVLGALGVLPFWLPVVAALIWPQTRAVAIDSQALYAAVILSFLAGTRLGLAILKDHPASSTLCLSMAPPILGWAVVAAPFDPVLRLVVLALALLAHAVSDARASDAPSWYARLRWPLSLGAISGLLAGVAVLHG